MAFSIQNYVSWNGVYTTTRNYAFAGYTWITNNVSHVYSRLPTINAMGQRYVSMSYTHGRWVCSKISFVATFIVHHGFNALNVGAAFVWCHKEVVTGSAVVITALLIVRYVIKNRPQLPVVRMESTLDVAKLDITIPKEDRPPVDVTLTFCVNTSGSMDKDERSGAVIRALDKVLDDAKKVVDQSKEAKISIVVTGFTDTSRVIIPITELTSTSNIQKIKNELKKISCRGSTSILEGLNGATDALTKMAEANKQGSHTLVLLTDGEDDINGQKLAAIHQKLASVSANLFAIGIGKEHNKPVLQTIAKRGSYIDTTSGKETIEGAISKIYNQAVASFHSFKLATVQLGPNAWSVLKTPSMTEEGRLKYDLGSLSEGQAISKIIKIHGNNLPTPLDLSSVSFSLTFVDPKGRPGEIILPWNPTTTIDPALLLFASKVPRSTISSH